MLERTGTQKGWLPHYLSLPRCLSPYRPDRLPVIKAHLYKVFGPCLHGVDMFAHMLITGDLKLEF